MEKIAGRFLCVYIGTCRKICTHLFCKSVSVFIVSSLAFNVSFAQKAVQERSLGTVKEFTSIFASADPFGKQNHVLRVADNMKFTIKVNVNNSKEDSYDVIGSIEGYDQSIFYFDGNKANVKGKLIFQKTKEAYDIYTGDSGEVFITPIDINEVMCVDYKAYKGEDEKTETSFVTADIKSITPQLESFPGAPGVIYLDFDGEYVTGGRWGTINALPSGFSDAQITTIWTIISEDYSPFNINVTTIRSLYDNANTRRRIMVIFTPTKDASPSALGVAFLNSFNDGRGDPCWSFGQSTKSAEEAASHESGHTFGLNHDGTSSKGYYFGHVNWAPIMGSGVNRPIVQWSKGEYLDANNKEDDLGRISNTINGVGYRTDDHGNDPPNATLLAADTAGSVKATDNFGIIEKSTDKDVFKFSTTGGTVILSIVAKTEPGGGASVPNLDIQARLLDAGGTEIKKVNPTGMLTTFVSLSQNLAAGTYYLEIDGVGYGDPLTTGYTDYGSLGQYFISGTVPGGASTGVNEMDNIYAINIFPNPGSGTFTIHAPLSGINESSIKILNSLGQVVMASSEEVSGKYQKEINLSNQSAGIYCVVLKAGNDVWRGKVMIK